MVSPKIPFSQWLLLLIKVRKGLFRWSNDYIIHNWYVYVCRQRIENARYCPLRALLRLGTHKRTHSRLQYSIENDD